MENKTINYHEKIYGASKNKKTHYFLPKDLERSPQIRGIIIWSTQRENIWKQ